MPEGDAIVKDATLLRPLLVEQPLEQVGSRWNRVVQGLVDDVVERITTHGKHLMLHFRGGVVLRVHRQMTGFWRTGPRRSDADARLWFRTAEAEVWLYNAPTVERIDARALSTHPVLSRLGPDVLADGFDPEEAVARCPPDMPVGLALLDQRVAAGIGNVYRAEALFYERQDPFTSFREVVRPARLWARGRQLMQRNLAHPGVDIRTREGIPSNWVYGRARQRCLRCGRRVQVADLGGLGRDGQEQLTRTVYWCPVCQPGGSVRPRR
jgi:endonuclease-8